jgi:hypothetical protein
MVSLNWLARYHCGSSRGDIMSFNINLSPFPIFDVLKYSTQFLEIKDVLNLSGVSKAYKKAMKNNELWSYLVNLKRLPSVEGRMEKSKRIFCSLDPISITAEIEKLYGEIRCVPSTTDIKYKMVRAMHDPFALPDRKKICEIFHLFVLPDYVIRPYDKMLFDQLSKKEGKPFICASNLDGSPKEMKIPFTRTNLLLLTDYLHVKQEMFHYLEPLLSHRLRKPGLYLMRNEVVYGHNFDVKKQKFEQRGCEVTLLPIPVSSNDSNIFDVPTYDESKVVPSSMLPIRGKDHPMNIGSFSRRTGDGISYGVVVDITKPEDKDTVVVVDTAKPKDEAT